MTKPESSLFRRITAPLGQVADFSGRTRRADYWPYMLLLVAIYFVGIVVVIGMFPFSMGSPLAPMYLLAAILILLAFAAAVRRLHDVGWSGWWMGAYVLMAIAFIALFFYWRYVLIPRTGAEPSLMFRIMPMMMIFSLAMNGVGLLVFIISLLDGVPGPNRYGPNPKDRSTP